MKYRLLWGTLFFSGVLSAAHLGYVCPAGGQAGEKITVLAGGQGLQGLKGIYVENGGGVVCKIQPVRFGIPHVSPPQRHYLQKVLRELKEGKPVSPRPEQEDWRPSPWFDKLPELTPFERIVMERALYVRPNALQSSPSIAAKILLTLEIAPDARPGMRYLRLFGDFGLTNPVPFFVGNNPEIQSPYYVPPYEKKMPVSFSIPASLNGQIQPGETDVFQVHLQKGESYYFKTYGRFFKPFIGDGVPGFFQPVLELRSVDGTEIARAFRDGLNPDPLLVCSVPEDGVYELTVRDALFRGRDDFVYRIECGTGICPRTHEEPELPDLPRLEYRQNLTVSGSALVTGIWEADEHHRIHFEGRKGEVKAFQTFVRQTGSDADPVLRLFSPDGKMLRECDDSTPEILTGRGMHFADCRFHCTLPEDGVYTLEIFERTGQAGKYVVKTDRARPDFELLCNPSAVRCINGDRVPLEILVLRREGFTGAVTLRTAGAPELALAGENVISPESDRTTVTLQVRRRTREKIPPSVFKIEGLAQINGETVLRTAKPVDSAMQAFAYTHYVEAPSLLWYCREKNPVPWEIGPFPTCQSGKPGETAEFRIPVLKFPVTGNIHPAAILAAPEYFTVESTRLIRGEKKTAPDFLLLKLNIAGNAPPGPASLVLDVPFSVPGPGNRKKTVLIKKKMTLPALRIIVEEAKK